MFNKEKRKYTVLGILFFLPVVFLLLLIPAQHNSTTLDIVNYQIKELPKNKSTSFKDNITVLAFTGNKPMQQVTSLLNLKQLVYSKFKGFKKFQIVALTTQQAKSQLDSLKEELYKYDELKYWHFITLDSAQTTALYNSLKIKEPLNKQLASNGVVIIDKDGYQRGRLDDRDKKEVIENKPKKALYSYNTVEVGELKNKLAGDDLRILFTEYRLKRKGKFNTEDRRKQDIKGTKNE